MIATVIIPTFNKVERLKLTLKSLENQTICKTDFEVIVINDGSVDDTKEFLEHFSGKLNLKAFHQNNLGQATARNIGIRNAQGSILIFTDDDVFCESTYVQKHIEWHEKHENFLAVIGKILYVPPDKYEEVEERLYCTGFHDSCFLSSYHKEDPYINMRRLIWENGYEYVKWICFTGANASVKGDLLTQVGIFDENFYGWGPEDAELGYRIFKADVPFIYDDTILNYHMDKLKNNTEMYSVLSKNLKYFKDIKYKNNIEINKYVSFGSCGISLEELNHICSGAEREFNEAGYSQLYYFKPLNYFNNKTNLV